MQASSGPHVDAASPVGPSVDVAASVAALEEAAAEDGAPATYMVTTRDRTGAARAMGLLVRQTARWCPFSRFWLQT